jgi:uncharacterized protein
MIEISDIIFLCLFSFLAGFIDSIIGGGGLVQTPAALFLLPQYPVPFILGTTKIPSMAGAITSAWQYSRKIKLIHRILLPIAIIAFCGSFAGSYLVSILPNSFMRPMAFVILIMVAIYTYVKKDFGSYKNQQVQFRVQMIYGLLMGLLVGFYDGFFGPGAGSFLVLGFIALIGFDFLQASAHAKLVNVATNIASILFFVSKGYIIFEAAIPMAFFNAGGAFIGSRLAILKGNGFIRIFFLLIVCATILRFGWDLFGN